jgi:hypothetical protein
MVSSQTDTFGNLVVVEVETCLRKEGEASCEILTLVNAQTVDQIRACWIELEDSS